MSKKMSSRSKKLSGLDKIQSLVGKPVDTDTNTLKRGKSVALYQQVKNYIVEMIESGLWQPGMKLPSENELIETLGIARMTVHRALRELTIEGYLDRIQGLGTFITQPKQVSGMLEIKPISEDIVQLGEEHSAVVHMMVNQPCPADLAREMGMTAGEDIYHSLITHHANGTPVQLADRFVNPAFAPGYIDQDFTQSTPSQYLFQQGPLTRAEHVIEAVMPDENTRQFLQMNEMEPCLLLHRKTWSGAVPVTRAKLYYPGTRFKLGGNFQPDSGKSSVVG